VHVHGTIDWYVAYHGTNDQCSAAVLATGLIAAGRPRHWISGSSLIVTPSIEYASHFKNARPWQLPSGEWAQMVLQLRVNPLVIAAISGDTITGRTNSDTKIDDNFQNSELEWRLQPVADESKLKEQVVCYGIMVRIAADPCSLAVSQWWHHTPPDVIRQYLPSSLHLRPASPPAKQASTPAKVAATPTPAAAAAPAKAAKK
jgi:hypothetical protein